MRNSFIIVLNIDIHFNLIYERINHYEHRHWMPNHKITKIHGRSWEFICHRK